MTTKQAELSRITALTRETEEKLVTLQAGLDALNNDITFLTHLVKQLGENIDILRQNDVITLAPEFKKIRFERKLAATRLETLKKDQLAFRIAISNGQNQMKILREQFDKVISTLDDNVIHVNFGRQANG